MLFMGKIVVFLLLISSVAFAQVKRGEYCSFKEGEKLPGGISHYPDSLYATYKEDTVGMTVTIVNTTKDTLYIFDSYLHPQFLGSKYLHRIDLNSKRYKLSLLPIVPHVFTKYSDNAIVSDQAIIGNHQIVYDFIKLPPGCYKQMVFKFDDIFRYKDSNNNVSVDYNVKLLNKNSKVPVKFFTTKGLTGKYDFFFEFAVYKKISLLCTQAAYYMEEYKFDKESKSFDVLTLRARINKYFYPLLR